MFGVTFGGGSRGGIVPRGLVATGRLAVGERRGRSGGLLDGGVVGSGVGRIATPDGFVVGVVVLGVCDGRGWVVGWGLDDGLRDGGRGIFLFFHLVELLDKLLELERADGFAPILDEAFDIPLEFACGLIAFIAVFGESAVDDSGELIGEVGSVLLDGDGAGVEDGTEHIDIGFSVEGSVVGGEFVHDDAKRKDIAASVEDKALDLFGRHVGEFAFDGSRLGFLGGLGFGDPEVNDLDDALEGEDDVLGGDISVDQVEVMAVGITEAVGIFETFADLRSDLGDVFGGEPESVFATDLDHRTEVEAVDVLHGDEVVVVVLSEFKDLYDIGVVHDGSDTRFVLEHLEELLVTEEVREDPLDNKLLFEAAGAALLGEMDFGHPAGCELFQE